MIGARKHDQQEGFNPCDLKLSVTRLIGSSLISQVFRDTP